MVAALSFRSHPSPPVPPSPPKNTCRRPSPSCLHSIGPAISPRQTWPGYRPSDYFLRPPAFSVPDNLPSSIYGNLAVRCLCSALADDTFAVLLIHLACPVTVLLCISRRYLYPDPHLYPHPMHPLSSQRRLCQGTPVYCWSLLPRLQASRPAFPASSRSYSLDRCLRSRFSSAAHSHCLVLLARSFRLFCVLHKSQTVYAVFAQQVSMSIHAAVT
ncbi:hypothetical protein B0H14DRAFT_2972159, partial [Mycena olivaceomarginata]